MNASIPFDAPFVPDEPGDRLLPGGQRDQTGLVEPIHDDTGRVVGYEVNF